MPLGRATQGRRSSVQTRLQSGSPVEERPTGASPGALGVRKASTCAKVSLTAARQCRASDSASLRAGPPRARPASISSRSAGLRPSRCSRYSRAKALAAPAATIDVPGPAQAVAPGRQIEVGDLPARRLDRRGRLLDGALPCRRDAPPLDRADDADAQRLRGRVEGRRLRGAEHRPDEGEILDAAGEPADGVEGRGQGVHSVAVDEAVGRLEGEDAAERGRADRRSSGLGSEGERDHTIGDGGGGAAGRSAGRVIRVVRVPRRAGRAKGELGGHRLAEDERAGLAECGDGGAVAGRLVALVERGAVPGGRFGGVEDVLHAERHAVQRPGGRHGVGRPGREQGRPRESSAAQAWTSGSRSSIRARQARTSASEVSAPSAMRRAASLAVRRAGSPARSLGTVTGANLSSGASGGVARAKRRPRYATRRRALQAGARGARRAAEGMHHGSTENPAPVQPALGRREDCRGSGESRAGCTRPRCN